VGLFQGGASQQGRRGQAVAALLILGHSLSRGLFGRSLLCIFFLSEAPEAFVAALFNLSEFLQPFWNSQQQILCTRVNSAYSCKSKVLEMGEGITLAISRVQPLPTALHN
jgi:hypothetical protein